MSEASHKKNPLYERWRIKIFLVTWLGYAAYYLTRKAFPVAKLGLEDDTSINITQEMMANIDATYLLFYAIGQFIFGMLVDRFGSRTIILAGMLTSAAAAALMGASFGYAFFIGVMVLQGLSQATGWSAFCKNISSFFSFNERGRVMGLWCSNFAVGSLVSTPFLALIAYSYFDSWRVAFWAAGASLFLVWLVQLLFQKNSPEDIGLPDINTYHGIEDECTTQECSSDSLTFKQELKIITSDRNVVLLGVVYFLLKPARYAILFWGPFIVYEHFKDAGKFVAATVPITFEIAGILSPLVLGYISDKYLDSRRYKICIVSLAGLSLSLFAFPLLLVSHSLLLVGVAFFFIGMMQFGPDAMLSSTAALETGSHKRAGTVLGFVNGCGSVGAIMGGVIPGYFTVDTAFILLASANLIAAGLLLPMRKK
jgi:sugar phosphate permease